MAWHIEMTARPTLYHVHLSIHGDGFDCPRRADSDILSCKNGGRQAFSNDYLQYLLHADGISALKCVARFADIGELVGQ
jgi:hypothetical protein